MENSEILAYFIDYAQFRGIIISFTLLGTYKIYKAKLCTRNYGPSYGSQSSLNSFIRTWVPACEHSVVVLLKVRIHYY